MRHSEIQNAHIRSRVLFFLNPDSNSLLMLWIILNLTFLWKLDPESLPGSRILTWIQNPYLRIHDERGIGMDPLTSAQVPVVSTVDSTNPHNTFQLLRNLTPLKQQTKIKIQFFFCLLSLKILLVIYYVVILRTSCYTIWKYNFAKYFTI